jgi:hypothetical protein
MLTFVKLQEASWVLANRYFSRTIFSSGNRKKSGRDKSGEHGGCSKAISLCWGRYFVLRATGFLATTFRKLDLFLSSGPVSETLCFLGFRIPDDGQGPETQ